jgi:CheY-like chemotaxis protein
MFQFRHINRLKYPQKHVLICEDDLHCQKGVIEHFASIFGPQTEVQFSVVPGALAAAAIISSVKIDVIILDHDMPQGNGIDLLNWLKSKNLSIPVITFSGIQQNNANMIVAGATHLFSKPEVMAGKADYLIRQLLELNVGVAETYINTVSPTNPTMARYWVAPHLLVGGNICDQKDWEHLTRDFSIGSVINVDGHTDKDKQIDNLLELPVQDDGNPFPADYVRQAVKFAQQHSDRPIYLHCHVGASRSPHFAYAVLRGCNKMTSEDALTKVCQAVPDYYQWGFNQHHASYLKSIEDALQGWDGQ